MSSHHRPLLPALTFLLFVAGCGGLQLSGQPIVSGQEDEESACAAPLDGEKSQVEEEEARSQSPALAGEEATESWGGGKDRALCYKLQPIVPAAKKQKKKIARSVGCCQPQSLIYARCRTGIATCRLGDTSPVQWFSCAKKMGNTSSVPTGGSVMVLDVNTRRRIYTGHPVYVEHAKKNGNGTWQLRISHTNYDRQCHLDQDAMVLFDPGKMTVSFQSGPWACWARDLKVLGFISG